MFQLASWTRAVWSIFFVFNAQYILLDVLENLSFSQICNRESMTSLELNEINSLARLAKTPVTESEGKAIFSQYATAAGLKDSWNHAALRAFLTDLQV